MLIASVCYSSHVRPSRIDDRRVGGRDPSLTLRVRSNTPLSVAEPYSPMSLAM